MEYSETAHKLLLIRISPPGLESIALDPKAKKLTVTGAIDPIAVVAKLRKICNTEIVSVGPAKEPEKKKEEPKKEEPKKPDEKKKDGPKEDAAAQLLKAYQTYYQHPYYYQHQHQYQFQPAAAAVGPPSYPTYYQRSAEEDPNSCVIC